MRYFELLNFQHVVLYIFPTLVFVVVFGLALGHCHLQGPDVRERASRIVHRFPEDIGERDAPFPLAMILILAGTLVWAFFYILGTGLWGVKI